ncbi:MAG: type I-C CRISPR-associated protein Cas8c/Csd1 [Synergistaceae bacterium]|nr:type I-C CRISPR-associated protein Cas8c/Csd1 [Synergistaceae bacterium]
MIIQKLGDFAIRESLVPDPDFELKPIAWLVNIGQDGRLLNIEGTHYPAPVESNDKKRANPKPKLVPKSYSVPRCGGRSSNDKAFFFCDKADYVFGVNIPGAKDPWPLEKLESRRALFLEQVRLCAEETADEAALSLLKCLENIASGAEVLDLSSLPEKVKSNDLFAFAYYPDGGALMTEREKIKDYWKRVRTLDVDEKKASSGVIRQCLATGEEFSGDVALFPLIKLPGGTTSGVGFVSFNSPAFWSYGWKRNENAPICREAAEAAAAALKRLTASSPVDPSDPSKTLNRQNIKLSSDTIVCYWSSGGDIDNSLYGMLNADPEKVGALYKSIWQGRLPERVDDGQFYALTLSGAQGRAVLRGWFESTIHDVQENLCRYFDDTAMGRIARGNDDVPYALSFLFESLADPAQRRDEAVPRVLTGEMVDAILGGVRYPETVLQRAVERYRSEIGSRSVDTDRRTTLRRNDARAALVKAVLNRNRKKEVKKLMDPDNTSQGYLLGRLMAVMEKLQVEAFRSDSNSAGDEGETSGKGGKPDGVNSTIVDRFFGGASATPKAVFPRLLVNSKHHERKLGEKHYGRMLRYSGYIDDILSNIGVNRGTNELQKYSDGFPSFLNLDEQGLFVIGYHHMRHWLWMNREERAKWEDEHRNAPCAYLSKRSDGDESSDNFEDSTEEEH